MGKKPFWKSEGESSGVKWEKEVKSVIKASRAVKFPSLDRTAISSGRKSV